MPRALRVAPGGVVFHVLNRANGRRVIFEKDEDYRAFEAIYGVPPLREIEGVRRPCRAAACGYDAAR